MKKTAQKVASESSEQQTLFRWAELSSGKYPELMMMHHIANGGQHNIIVAAHLKAEGVKAGVPDICLPVPNNKYHGLYIELKRRKNGRISPMQEEWINALNHYGYLAVVCYGWEHAAQTIEEYLKAR